MTFETTVPRILFIDSYDSFTFNLVSLCRGYPDCAVHIIKNDAFTIEQLLPFLPLFSAVVVGPGPGSPQNDQDIGVIKDLWGLAANVLLPIFGVCLGLQSLGVAYGARLERLNVVKHGQASLIHHTGRELFEGVGLVEAVRYHSLHVTLLDAGEVEQLAWADDGSENGLVVMAMRHTSKPFWAVQYHPESVCTQGGGRDVVSNFWSLAQTWSNKHGRRTSMELLSFLYFWKSSQIVSTRILDLPNLTARQVCELFGVANDESPFVLLDSAAQPGRHSIIGSLLPSSPQLSYFVGTPM
ncbi:unnamed protein product [Mycena citricolor]|uniref:anthranilate synthase n=1 Tax=Mycena citricolor TaxID=2018698 RepID=A0AAD2GYN3_9AGAR|nr:unnamed protein product [Mycena citricolor]